MAEGLACKDGYVNAGSFFLPGASTVSTHILKPQLKGRFEGLIEAEAWAMTVASAAARCAKVTLDDVLAEARSWGVPGLDVSGVLEETLDSLRLGMEAANALYPAAGEKFAGAVDERIASLMA